ncbi:hypothetical protein BSKO_00727 [Bryopsis sp. KO-2023]|nr:hypothetical protein BSKO_00727 [Bryopsis sp. KO-2023]
MDKRSLAIFVVGGVAGASIAFLCLKRLKFASETRSTDVCAVESKDVAGSKPSAGQLQKFLDDDILREQLTRNIQFFGEESQLKVANSFVVVVGLGGVGSHLAHLLLRSGVGRLRLVDFDLVSLSSLNRHAVATREDVGTPKAACLDKHFKRILPEAEVEPMVMMYTEQNEDAILSGKPDFVIDAIDNTDTKVSLLVACHRRGIPVLCCGGAGAKADPTRLRFVDISESSADPLCRKIRHRLRRHDIERGIPVLLSTEQPRCSLLSLGDTEMENPLDYQIVPNFRVRTIPVLGTAPAVFGMAAASFVLCQLAEQPYKSEPMFTIQPSQCETQYDRLQEREELTFQNESGTPVDLHEVTFLVREVWRGVSAKTLGVPGHAKDKGLNRKTDHLVLTRWDCQKPPVIHNLVLLTFDEAESHDLITLDAVERNDKKFFDYVENVLGCVKEQF